MTNDEKWQIFGRALGDVAEYVLIYLGILLAVIVLVVILLIRYSQKRKAQPENTGQPKQNTALRILIMILIGGLVFLISPIILSFFLH